MHARRQFRRTGAVLMALAFAVPSPGLAQEPPPASATLDDVVVTGRRLEEAVRQYVESVSAPARMRGLARWDDDICVKVVNFQPAVEAEVAGRIREVAEALEIPVEAEGCDPNIVVMGTEDGPALAGAIVDRFRSRFFRFGSTRTNRGSAALERFRDAEGPVRWWHVSMPVHAVSGEPMIRLPGRPPVSLPCSSRSTATFDLSVAGIGGSRTGWRCNAVTDRIIGLWIVVDVNALSGLSAAQLADYLAFVAVAQVDPDADMSSFDTVLNLFERPDTVSCITGWDETYLTSLYSGDNERLDPTEQAERMLEALPPTPTPASTPPVP